MAPRTTHHAAFVKLSVARTGYGAEDGEGTTSAASSTCVVLSSSNAEVVEEGDACFLRLKVLV